MSKYVMLAMLVLAGTALAWDPLYYSSLSRVLQSMEADGDVALGFFSSPSYWATDSAGESQSYDFSTSLSVLRVVAIGRYGLTNSHTVSIVIPAFVQLAGEGDSTGAGIADPWVSLDGWIQREPMIIARGALRIPLKGYLESGDYSESDRHLALDGAVTVESEVSPGTALRGTAGLRYSMSAWDRVPGSKDSADTRPPIELRGTGFAVFSLNPELDLRVGAEFSTRGSVSAKIDDSWQTLENTGVSSVDLRAGFDLENESTTVIADVYYRLSGENTVKEWGIMVTGLGLDFTDLFSTGSGGGR
jgi:hypothetical protein